MQTEQLNDRELRIGPVAAEPGRKTRVAIPVALDVTGVEIPITLVNGTRPGPRIVITAGVHGGEFVGIEAAVRLVDELRPDAVCGQLVICPVANPPAAYASRTGLSALDQVNINRVFPGETDGGPTARLAAWLFATVLDGADAYIDLHSGGIDEVLADFVGYRVSGQTEVDERAGAIACAAGYPDVIVSASAEGGNSHAAAARAGIPAVLIETGDRGRCEPALVETALAALRRILAHLGALPAPDRGTPAAVSRQWRWAGGVSADARGLWFPAFDAGDDVTDGQVIGRIVDPVDGAVHVVTADATGRIFYGMHGRTVDIGAELAAIAAPVELSGDQA